MRIPLPKMLRSWRQQGFEQGLGAKTTRTGLVAWAFLARRPALYRPLMALGVGFMALFGGRGRFKSLPLADGWTASRDLAAPEGRTFLSQWKAGKR